MWTPESYTFIASLLPKLVGLIYLFAFAPFLFQIEGLVGDNGILPVGRYLNVLERYYGNKRFYVAPSLFWFNSSDKALQGIILLGCICSLCLIFGIFPAYLMLFLLYFLYLSILSIGQDFLSFGWEGFLLETTAHVFLISLTVIPNSIVWFSINFLLFRFHFMAGVVKFQSRDPNWKNQTAIAYHYQTQPLPSTLAWYFHKLPLSFHKLTCLVMFIIELVVPFGIFLNADIRFFVFLAFFSLQYFIWISGNYSFLNYLTVVLSTILISNHVLSYIFTLTLPENVNSSLTENVIISLLGALLFGLQLIRFWHQLVPNQIFGKILATFSPFHLANRYGIFAIMTTKRYEVVIEGSNDNVHWEEYTFWYKPSEITRRPRRIAPYQPRIDWQAWFLPFEDYTSRGWFENFLYHLLKGTPEVLKLIRGNPFKTAPPKYIRALFYDYEFSSSQEKREYGWWWKRTYMGHYSPTLTLTNQKETL